MQIVAIVPRDIQVPYDELSAVASAVNVQVIRDLAAHWKVQASVSAYTDAASVQGQNPFLVYVVADTNGSDGVHRHEDSGTTFAFVRHQPGLEWSVAASHETLEMLVDPSLNYTIAGMSPRDPTRPARVLVEVCDPCQSPDCAYPVDDGHAAQVSDFCLPAYYGSGQNTGPYTFMRTLTAPLTIASGGYLTWIESDAGGDAYYQLSAVAGPQQIFGPVDPATVFGKSQEHRFLRAAVDRCTALPGRPIHFQGAGTTAARSRLARRAKTQVKSRISLQKYVDSLLK